MTDQRSYDVALGEIMNGVTEPMLKRIVGAYRHDVTYAKNMARIKCSSFSYAELEKCAVTLNIKQHDPTKTLLANCSLTRKQLLIGSSSRVLLWTEMRRVWWNLPKQVRWCSSPHGVLPLSPRLTQLYCHDRQTSWLQRLCWEQASRYCVALQRVSCEERPRKTKQNERG